VGYDLQERSEVVCGRKDDGEGAMVGAIPSIFDPHAEQVHPHVSSDIRSQSLVETDSNKSISLTSQINNLPFLPIRTPCSDTPTSPSTRFDPITRSIMRYTRMSDFSRGRTRDGSCL